MPPIKARDLFAEFQKDDAYRKAHQKLATQLILARNVLRRRAELSLSQTALAEAAGMRQPRIADLEGGRSNVRLETLDRIAAALNTTPDRLIRADAGPDGYERTGQTVKKSLSAARATRKYTMSEIHQLVRITSMQAEQPTISYKVE